MKSGYIIAKNGLTKDFFTSSSAYDRPKWIGVNEATVYATAELADNAVKKLYKNGAYSAKVVSLKEMNLEIEPMDDEIEGDELPVDGAAGLGDEGGDELDPEGGLGDEGDEKDEDEMAAGEQQDVCPECEHDPCTCETEGDDELSDDDLVIDDIEGEDEFGDEFGDELDGEGTDELDGEGNPDEEGEQETDPRFDGRRLGMAQLSPMGSPRRVGESAAPKVDDMKVKDCGACAQDDNAMAKGNDEKCKVPSDVTSELKAAISKYEKEAEFNKHDDARASFCLTAADAMKAIQTELAKGTVEGVKAANIKLTSYMSPITNNIPASVIKFVTSGGVKPSLKDMFNAKRDAKK